MLTQNDISPGNADQQLQAAYLLSMEQIANLTSKITSLEAEVARLKEQLRLSQLRQFGKKSEVGELSFNPNEPNPSIAVSGYTRTHRKKSCGRIIDTSQLLRRVIHYDLSNKTCTHCQNPLHFIEKESTEKLEVLPMRLYVVEHVQYKYGCRHCQIIQMGQKPLSAIPKALAGESLISEILVNKYQYHLPLYRQSKILASFNAIVPDNTLGNWIMQAGTGLMKLYDALWQVILSARYLQVDETPVKVLKTDKKGYVWSYFAPHVAKGVVVFEMSLTRSSDVAAKRLAPFKGLLQTDGYIGYQSLRQRAGIEGLGCMTHARRKFSEVFKITKNSAGIAAEALKRLKPLYELESSLREKKVSFHTRKRLRQKIAWPILKEFRRWLRQNLREIPPKSQLAHAIAYTLNQWKYIIKYVRHGMAELDTNWVENQIRDIALGRKNWLFMRDEDSGLIHALFYSLVLTCILNNLNPRLYLHYMLSRMHDLRKNIIDPKDFLPHTIDCKLLQAFGEEQIALAKQVLDSS